SKKVSHLSHPTISYNHILSFLLVLFIHVSSIVFSFWMLIISNKNNLNQLTLVNWFYF
uniref:Uncharacterized protein n=1 Tax=Ciona intestinalis TaxID=7719 RepID=H2Y0C5_CIOIN